MQKKLWELLRSLQEGLTLPAIVDELCVCAQ